MNVVERAKAPTPSFLKILRAIGLAMMRTTVLCQP